jgi:hypothetical protein
MFLLFVLSSNDFWLSSIPMFVAKMSASFTSYIVKVIYMNWARSCDH